MKLKIEFSICTGLMLNDHSNLNPYIESTTVLSREGQKEDRQGLEPGTPSQRDMMVYCILHGVLNLDPYVLRHSTFNINF